MTACNGMQCIEWYFPMEGFQLISFVCKNLPLLSYQTNYAIRKSAAQHHRGMLYLNAEFRGNAAHKA